MKNNWIFVSVIIVIFINGCSPRYNPANTPFSAYNPIKRDDVRKLEKGVTTPTAVVNIFGEPTKKNLSEKGERYIYGYLGDTLSIGFDNDNKLENFLFREAVFTPIESNIDNQRRNIAQSRIDRLRIYEHTRFDLEKWFRKANLKETTEAGRNRYTFNRKNGTLVVYTLDNMEERIITYSFTPKQ